MSYLSNYLRNKCNPRHIITGGTDNSLYSKAPWSHRFINGLHEWLRLTYGPWGTHTRGSKVVSVFIITGGPWLLKGWWSHAWACHILIARRVWSVDVSQGCSQGTSFSVLSCTTKIVTGFLLICYLESRLVKLMSTRILVSQSKWSLMIRYGVD